ncbi:MAG: UDP-N-acetylglucosamine--LPS N-acetylglucosamine transferase [Planctomycetaceae bacterium]|nr:UDP-N-acetylglucosamine--LPS N-acetylglucosamine transferase [Planctomycetaceae bacterium]
MSERRAKILAVSSGGGHWVQLQRLRPAFVGHHVTFVTVGPCDTTAVSPDPVKLIPDANARTPFRMVWLLFRMAWIVLRIRPDVVITTGAAPGYWAIRFGRWCGAKTVFIDSIANAEHLSFSGRLSLGRADVTLTQWSDLAQDQGPCFWGSVV